MVALKRASEPARPPTCKVQLRSCTENRSTLARPPKTGTTLHHAPQVPATLFPLCLYLFRLGAHFEPTLEHFLLLVLGEQSPLFQRHNGAPNAPSPSLSHSPFVPQRVWLIFHFRFWANFRFEGPDFCSAASECVCVCLFVVLAWEVQWTMVGAGLALVGASSSRVEARLWQERA